MLVLLLFQVYWVFLSNVVENAKRINDKIIENKVLREVPYIELRAGKFSAVAPSLGPDEESIKRRTENYRRELELDQLSDQLEANNELLGWTKIFGTGNALQIQAGTISLDIMSQYLLPILYGLVGACAYILRTISKQIKERTFTGASNTLLQLRMVLGALAGFSIAWFANPKGGVGLLESLTPFALAFLAGYSVELLFSAMDTLIEAFSNGRASS